MVIRKRWSKVTVGCQGRRFRALAGVCLDAAAASALLVRSSTLTAIGAAGADLVDLIDEDDAALLHGADGFLLDVDCLRLRFKRV